MPDELERVRAYRSDVPEPDAATVTAARAELVEAMRAEPRGTARPAREKARLRKAQRRRRFALAGAIAAAGLAVAGVFGFHTAANPQPALAATMDRLARIVPGEDWSGVPGPGQYLYTKSIEVYASHSGQPHVVRRQDWLASDGSDLFNSASAFTGTDTITKTPPGGAFPTTVAGWQKLSTDPATLLKQVHQIDGGPPTAAEEFVNVTDALRETSVPPAMRAALYEALGQIPGVTLLGGVQTDPAGQTGVGVEYKANGPTDPQVLPTKLIFDQQTGRMLAEETLNQAGMLTGWTSYPEQKIVDSAPAAGSPPPSTDWPSIDTSNLAAPTPYVGPTVTVVTSPSGTPETITSSTPAPSQTTTTP